MRDFFDDRNCGSFVGFFHRWICCCVSRYGEVSSLNLLRWFEHGPKPSKHQTYTVFNNSNVTKMLLSKKWRKSILTGAEILKKYAEFNGAIRSGWNLLKWHVFNDFLSFYFTAKNCKHRTHVEQYSWPVLQYVKNTLNSMAHSNLPETFKNNMFLTIFIFVILYIFVFFICLGSAAWGFSPLNLQNKIIES